MAITGAGIVGRSDLLRVDPRVIQTEEGWNPRADFGDIEALAEDIKANGVRVALQLWKRADGSLVLDDGERRLKATMKLINEGCDIASVPAIIVPKGTSEVERFYIALSCNQGKPLTVVEQAKAFQRLRNWGVEVKEIARRTGTSPSTVSTRLALVERATPAILSELAAGNINLSMATEAAKAADTVEGQTEVLKSLTPDLPDRVRHPQMQVTYETDRPADKPAKLTRIRRANGTPAKEKTQAVKKSPKPKKADQYEGMIAREEVESLINSLRVRVQDKSNRYKEFHTGAKAALEFVLGKEAITMLNL